MPIGTYYLSKTGQGEFGSVFLLKQLQHAESSSGGGKNLLGSMVQWISKFLDKDYPIPACMSTPRALIHELENRRQELGITGDVTLQIKVAPGSETIKLERSVVFDSDVGPFPVIPFNMNLDIDYSRMQSIDIIFGEGTYSEYIPTGYMTNLYQKFGGKPSDKIGGELLMKNAYINQIVLAKNYSVSFESTELIDAGFDTKLATYNQLPDIGGKVKITKQSDYKVKAEVNSSDYYVIALTASRWDKLKW